MVEAEEEPEESGSSLVSVPAQVARGPSRDRNVIGERYGDNSPKRPRSAIVLGEQFPGGLLATGGGLKRVVSAGKPAVLIVDPDDVAAGALMSCLAESEAFELRRPLTHPSFMSPSARPDVMVLDPEVDGAIEESWLRVARERAPAARLVLFTRAFSETSLKLAFDARAQGYLLKGRTPRAALREAMSLVALYGLVVMDPAIQAFFAAEPERLRLTPTPTLPARLAEREREILSLHAAGRSDKDIAARLGIGASTVETHMQRLLAKLDARNRSHAVYLAVYYGLLDPSSGDALHD